MLRFAHMVFVWVFIIVMPVWCACLTFFFLFWSFLWDVLLVSWWDLNFLLA